MPEFFPFIPGTETSRQASHAAFDAASTPLLGRFRAHLPRRVRSRPSGLFGTFGAGSGGSRARPDSSTLLGPAGGRGSVHVGYGALLVAAGLENEQQDEEDDEYDDDDDESEDGYDPGSGYEGGGYGRTTYEYDEDDDEGGQGSNWDRVCCWWKRKSSRRRRRRPTRTAWRRMWRRNVLDLWVEPKQSAVKRVVNSWWSRWGALVILPAGLAVAWCAIPFPQYPLPKSHKGYDGQPGTSPSDPLPPGSGPGHRVPGHGSARVQVNFWFFLLCYYSFYCITALIWITKVFNLYSLNWWPTALGFPLTVSIIAVLSLAVPIPIYLAPETHFLTKHNTAWISWTFVIMAMPVAIAFCILMTHERHLGLRHSLSETQRIFTSSWWTGEAIDSSPTFGDRRRRDLGRSMTFDPDVGLHISSEQHRRQRGAPALMERRRWLPASFVRFIWFCLALTVGLLAYLIGEAYAEIYLRTLPHNNFETIVYVYSWVVTVHLLDALTGWILGGNEGERVGSYPLSWVFKLYFMLTYQTYVRALYARLRSPSQFIWLQALSSGFLIVLTPLTMTRAYHRGLGLLGLTGLSYLSYQKVCVRNVFIRGLAENVSMLTFLGSVLVLHFGANKDVYPYFAFDDPGEPYDFRLTAIASATTWACERAAGLALRALVRWSFGVDPAAEGRLDLAVWPELLPASVAVMLHVVQNMLFSIIRLHF